MLAILDSKTAAEACRIEHQILEHVKNALRVTLDWQVDDVGIPRKISSVCFTFKSFQRHLERLMAIEENGGYMLAVAEYKPNLSHQAESLRCEHDDIRSLLANLVVCVESAPEEDVLRCSEVCEAIAAVLARVDRHDRDEMAFLQEAFLHDEGGEG